MAKIEFNDFSADVKGLLEEQGIAWIYEVAREIVSQAARNSRKDTGQLKGSWKSFVDETKLTALVGSPLQNAIWEEFGTGIYAVNGDGRKDPWLYTDRNGITHFTRGKYPNRTLERAFISVKPKAERHLEELLKELNSK